MLPVCSKSERRPVHRGNAVVGRETGTGVALKRHGIHDVDQPVVNLLTEAYVTGQQHSAGPDRAVFHFWPCDAR